MKTTCLAVSPGPDYDGTILTPLQEINMTTTMKEALERARAEAQQLHQRLDAANAANHATLRAELQKTIEHAETIAAAIRESASEQDTQTKRHLDEAANALRDAGHRARGAATAGEAKLKSAGISVAARVRDALKHISEAASENRTPASTEKN